MSVHNGHRERMRQEFLSGGLAHFSEPRVLELLLFYSRPRGDVNPLAHQLLETFGSLAGVLDASPTDLAQVPGMGENTVALLKLIPAIAARYLASRTNADVIISDSASLQALFVPYFFGARNELSFVACFDGKLKLLGVKQLSEGTPTANEINTPSQEDIFLTHYVQQSLQPLGITLYDHVILTDDDMVSLRDSRHLTPPSAF